MKQIAFDGRSFLLDDETAHLLLEYAAALIQHGTGDAVDMQALSMNGDEIDVRFLVSAGVSLMAESSRSDLTAPENGTAIASMRAAIDRLTAPPAAMASHETMYDSFDAYDL